MLKPGSVVHVIGACGTAMATFAAMLAERGHRVRGSDQNVYPPMSDVLREKGIELRTPYATANLEPTPDLVVVGNAIPRDNPEMESFFGRFKTENRSLLLDAIDLENLRRIVDDRMRYFNEERRHSTLGNRCPHRYLADLGWLENDP